MSFNTCWSLAIGDWKSSWICSACLLFSWSTHLFKSNHILLTTCFFLKLHSLAYACGICKTVQNKSHSRPRVLCAVNGFAVDECIAARSPSATWYSAARVNNRQRSGRRLSVGLGGASGVLAAWTTAPCRPPPLLHLILPTIRRRSAMSVADCSCCCLYVCVYI